ncbi:MAG: response regulator, partial [Thermoplasmatota archaeon]
IILDYLLPDTQGVALLRAMRDAGAKAPVVALTGHGSERVAQEFVMAGATDLLAKDDLTEARLLPGALMRNSGIRFVGRDVAVTVENSQSVFTARYDAGEEVVLPVAHHDGNFQADEATLDRLEGERQESGRRVLAAEMLRLRDLVRLAEARRIIAPARA